jgi:signal transduction histidine kinase
MVLSDDAGPGPAASTVARVTSRPDPSPTAASAGDGSAALARTLRGAMHVAFLVLPAVGAARAVTADGVPIPLAILAAAVLVGIYLLGSQRALRRGAAGRADRTDLLLPAAPWVLALALAWMASTFVSASFVWIAFTLFFLVLFALGPVGGPLALALVTLWAILAPVLGRQEASLGVGEVLGPLIGAVFSLVAHAVYQRLLRETDRNRLLVAQLRAAQADLADSERRKGIAEERQRLAGDIHDSLAQGLNSIVMLSRAAGGAHPSAAGEFSRIESTARENLADARRLVRDLADRAPRTTLEQALHGVIASAEALGETPRWELRVDGTPVPLEPAQVETLHRAAQSLVANVQRHAAAQRCVLTLAWWPDRVSLDVVDDGRGFDPSAAGRAAAGGGAVDGAGAADGAGTTNGAARARRDGAGTTGGDGLRLLRARIDRAGGTVTIDSTPGEGTAVGLTLPLREQEARA